MSGDVSQSVEIARHLDSCRGPRGQQACDCGAEQSSLAAKADRLAMTYNVTRFACHCGRFLAESAIRCTDFRDDGRYYGIRTEVEWDCGRCGTVKGEEWEPQIVVTATRSLPPGEQS